MYIARKIMELIGYKETKGKRFDCTIKDSESGWFCVPAKHYGVRVLSNEVLNKDQVTALLEDCLNNKRKWVRNDETEASTYKPKEGITICLFEPNNPPKAKPKPEPEPEPKPEKEIKPFEEE